MWFNILDKTNSKGFIKMNEIVFIFRRGFREIMLPSGERIYLRSRDDGCYVTTDNLEQDVKKIQQYIGYVVREILHDSSEDRYGGILTKCEIVNHSDGEGYYPTIFIWAER